MGAAHMLIPHLRREEFKEAIGGAASDGGVEGGARSAIMGAS
jgi:hypothetical protein